MYLVRVEFGAETQKTGNPDELQDEAEYYLVSLSKNGQICGDPLWTESTDIITAYCYLPRPKAFLKINHSAHGKRCLRKIEQLFQHTPEWSIQETDVPTRFPSWKQSTSFYVFTHLFDLSSAVCCGDSGKPIPPYLLPIDDLTREHLDNWTRCYRMHDSIWIDSGTLEIPAYKELADPQSRVSSDGRDLCKEIEAATGKPTYYFLQRYWGRRQGEESRKCPGCGRKWHILGSNSDTKSFHEFHFRCERCRLVSNPAVSFEDERHARIGEYRKQKVKQ